MRTIVAAVLLCGTAFPALAQDVSAVKEASQRFTTAMTGGDAAAAGAMFSEDAFVLPPGRGELKSKSEIQQFLGNMTKAVQGLQYTSEDVRPIGDNAAREIGTFSFKMKGRSGGGQSGGGQSGGGQAGSGSQSVSGKYLIIWEKSGSEWKIAADMWNRNGGGGGQGGARGGMGRRGGAGGGAGGGQGGGAQQQQ